MSHFEKCWYAEDCDGYTEGCTDYCPVYIKLKYMLDNSGIPENKQRPIELYPLPCDLEAFRRLADIKEHIYDFVQEGKSLYIASSITGNGKSTWSMKLLMRYFEEMAERERCEVRGIFINVPTFLAKLKKFDGVDSDFEKLKKSLLEADVVVWDDIAGSNLSNYDYLQLLSYIDGRYMNELSNIYTSNITDRDDLEKLFGAKLVSRIWNRNTEVVTFYGGDRR